MASPPSLAAYAEERGVRYFLVSFMDLFGVQRSKLVPAPAIGGVQRGGAGFAGFATYLDMTPAHPDMFAMPDADAVFQLPWKKEVAWVAADLVMDNKLVDQAPRNVLKAQVAALKDMGLEMKTGVECEFFLLNGANEVADTKDVAEKPCYDQAALMRQYEVVTEVCEYMTELGWKPYQMDHEDGNGQFEFNWEYNNSLVTADRHTFFKFMMKSVAEKHGLKATFMPKPFENRTGNGAHCHISLWNNMGTNVFEDEHGELGLSSLAYNFIGGVLANAKLLMPPRAVQALCAFTNPTVNSYKRTSGATTASGSSWAPCTISYTGNNRTHMLRIPDTDRFEFRLADGAVNPYLLQASLLGLEGIEQKSDPGPRADWNGHVPHPEMKLQTLPDNLLDALRELSSSEVLKRRLGEQFVESYVKLRMQQWRSYSSQLSKWELDNTLDC
eukprot:SM000008S22208  [mRNA]  locus=s8:439452:443279:+ [translate_table: standard]